MKCRWNRTMLNVCGIVAAILKMVTARNMSRHWTISSSRHFQNGRKNSTLSDIIKIWYVGRCPDIEKFLAVTIFKMAATIPHTFNIVRFQRHFICGKTINSNNSVKFEMNWPRGS
jgi:hypothetical protein